MTKKPAALSANLVAIKGSAAPAPDMVGRRTPLAPESSLAETSPPVVRRSGEGEGGLTPLNFRVPAAFRREFKTYAARHDLKLNELLRLSFEAYRGQRGE